MRQSRLFVLLLAFASALPSSAQETRGRDAPATPEAAAVDHDESHAADARGRSRQENLLADPLAAAPGKQAHLLRIVYPPGWVGRRHYHTGDVFLYVLEGRFTVEVDGGKQTTIGPGEVYHEAVRTVMQARNPSQSQPTKLLLFQVGGQGERLTVITD
jgi:quercetin dioxygenase-like cupin family protein